MIQPQYHSLVRQVTAFTEVDGSSVKVKEYADRQGWHHLRCPCPRFQKKHWCWHVETTIRDGRDAAPELLEATVVPLFIHPDLLYVPVVVAAQVIASESMREVFLPLGGPLTIKKTGLGSTISVLCHESHSIGFIGRSEGRSIIRQLLIDFLVAAPVIWPEMMECQSAYHPSHVNLDFKSMRVSGGRLDRAKVSHVYDLLNTKICRFCTLILEGQTA